MIDPTKPMKGCRTAWRHLTTMAGLKGLRFDDLRDLRHQAITELCGAGLSDMTIMGIAGHVSREASSLFIRTFDFKQGARLWPSLKLRCRSQNPMRQPSQ